MFRMEHPLSVFRVEHFAYTGVNKHQAWWDPCLHQCKRRAEQGGRIHRCKHQPEDSRVYTSVNVGKKSAMYTGVSVGREAMRTPV